MWPIIQVRIAGCAIFFLVLDGYVGATSIVAQVDADRILLAADTHGDKLDLDSKSSDESECKIVPLGNAAFALTGGANYVRHQVDDPIVSWDSRSDVREAYIQQSGDLIATANDWTARAKRHYSAFYLTNPRRVKELAKANDQNILLAGMFVGFQAGKALLLVELVYLDERGLQPILDKQVILPARKLAYSSNGITQDLIDGQSAKAKSEDAAWLKKLSSTPFASRAFRRLEFVIQATAKYDKTVGTRVNVLEISPHKSPHWLQNFTC